MILFPRRHLMGVLEYHQLTPPNNMVELKNPTAVCELRAEKKNVQVVCLVGARSLLRPEKKQVQVICLAGARSLLQAGKKKVPVVCLAGVRSVLRAEKKKF